MGIQVIRQFRRPNTEVPFHQVLMDSTYFEYMKATYKETGKLTSIDMRQSNDMLVLTATYVWRDQDAYNEYLADPTCVAYMNKVKEYNLDNNIVVEPKLVSEV